MSSFASLSDDFGVSVYLASKVDVPTNRETVLHFFDAVKRQFPTMTDFEKRDNGEHVLEEDRDPGHYRWVSLDGRRMAIGCVNPEDMEPVDATNEWLLEAAPYHLGVFGLDAEALDVLYYFDFLYAGNHDDVVVEALALGGPFESLTKMPGAKPLSFQPTMMMALDDGCQLQCRLSIETRSTAYHVRTGNYPESPISVYFTVRQFWGKQPYKTFVESYRNQRKLLDELVGEHVVPNVIQPLARTIGARQ
jgi:hypothetical protein